MDHADASTVEAPWALLRLGDWIIKDGNFHRKTPGMKNII